MLFYCVQMSAVCKPIQEYTFYFTVWCLSNNKHWLTNCKVLNPPNVVVLGDGHKLFAHGIGTLAVTLHLDNIMNCTADMQNCLFVPDMSCSLLSVRSATSDGTKSVSFGRNGVRITDFTNRVITTGSLTDGVYTLNCTVLAPNGSSQCSGNLPHDRAEGESNAASQTNACLVAGVLANLWHRRVGHMGEQNVNKSVNVDLVKDMPISKQEMTFCEPCVESETVLHTFGQHLGLDTFRRVWPTQTAIIWRKGLLCHVHG